MAQVGSWVGLDVHASQGRRGDGRSRERASSWLRRFAGRDGAGGGRRVLGCRARPGQREQPSVLQQRDRGLEIRVAAQQRRRRRRQRRRRRGATRRGSVGLERGVVRQDLRLQPLQRRARVEAEILDQRVARPPVGLERVGLAPGAGKGRASAARGTARGTSARPSAPRARRRAPRPDRPLGRARSAVRARPAATPPTGRLRSRPGRTAARRPAAGRGTAPAPRAAARRPPRAAPRRRARPGSRSARGPAAPARPRSRSRSRGSRLCSRRPRGAGARRAPEGPWTRSRAARSPTARRSGDWSKRRPHGAPTAAAPAAHAASAPPRGSVRRPRQPAAGRGSRTPLPATLPIVWPAIGGPGDAVQHEHEHEHEHERQLEVGDPERGLPLEPGARFQV